MSIERDVPTIFISSTCYDLKQVREDLKDFFEQNYGFITMLSEFDSFPIDPCIGTFENCLNNVDTLADIFVLIIGKRYGYVMDSGKSITNLEYLHAKSKGIPLFVFVDKELYNQIPIWKTNKEGDFSSIVDNPQIFQFVSEIYNESYQWIYTYESVKDIKSTMKHQLGLIFADGLFYKKVSRDLPPFILQGNIPTEAKRVLIEKPFAWEYKFWAYVLKNEFDKLQEQRWNLQYGFHMTEIISMEGAEFLNEITLKLEELMGIIENISVLLNETYQEAIGSKGEPSDLEMILYVAKQFSMFYERIVSWGLYFKTLHTDKVYKTLLQLLYEFPKSVLKQIDDFVNEMCDGIITIPDVRGDEERRLSFTCEIDADTEALDKEIENLMSMFCG